MHDGNGIMKSPDGYIYDGTWENGVKQGTAKVTYPDGSIYTGEISKGVREGKGRLEMPEGCLLYTSPSPRDS